MKEVGRDGGLHLGGNSMEAAYLRSCDAISLPHPTRTLCTGGRGVAFIGGTPLTRFVTDAHGDMRRRTLHMGSMDAWSAW